MGLLDAITGWAKSAGQQAYQNVIRSGQRGYESSRQAHGGRAPAWPIVTQQTRQAQQARSGAGGRGGESGGEVTAVKGIESGSHPTESMTLYPIYTAAKSLAESYKKNVTDRFSGLMESRPKESPGALGVALMTAAPAMAPTLIGESIGRELVGRVAPGLKGPSTREFYGQAATGLVSSPGLTAEFLGMIPAGAERLARETVREPSALPKMAAAGLMYQAEGLTSGFRESPGRTAGELLGMGLLTHGITRGAAKSPVRPAVGKAKFPLESYTSLGIETTSGKVVGFQPVIGIGKTVKGFKPAIDASKTVKGVQPRITTGTPGVNVEAALGGKHVQPAIGTGKTVKEILPATRPIIRPTITVGTPKINIETALGGERFTPRTPLETRIVQKALGGQEAARIDYARNVRKVTQASGLTLKQATPIVQEVVKQHNIPKPKAVSQAIVTRLRTEGAQLYGSVVQRGIGEEVGKPGLSRIPRDFDIQVTSAEAFQKQIVADINRVTGRSVVAPEGRGGVIVRKTGEKLFDIHDAESALADMEREFSKRTPSEYIAFGIKGEKPVPTQEGIPAITLSEQATRKLAGSMQLRPTVETLQVPGSTLTLKGRLLPEHPGRIKDIADTYFAEKLAVDVMKGRKNPITVARATVAEDYLNKYLETWGRRVAASVRIEYAKELARGSRPVKLLDFSEPAVKTPTVTASGVSSGAFALGGQAKGMTSPQTYTVASEIARGGSGSKGTITSSSLPGVSVKSPPSVYTPPSYPSSPPYSPPSSPPYSPPSSPPYSPPYIPPSPPYIPQQKRIRFKDERKLKAIRPDLTLKGFDWTVTNPVPTWESVFGTTKTPKTPNITITLPEFKL